MVLSCSALAKRDGSCRRKERRTEGRTVARQVVLSHPCPVPLGVAELQPRLQQAPGALVGSPRTVGALLRAGTEELPGRAGGGQGCSPRPMSGSQDACVHKFLRNLASETRQRFRNVHCPQRCRRRPAGNLCRARDEAGPPLPCCTLPRATAQVPPWPFSHCSSLDFPLPFHPFCFFSSPARIRDLQ